MHLKLCLKLKKPLKLSILGKYIKKNKKTKKTHWVGFFLNPGFFQPCLAGLAGRGGVEGAVGQALREVQVGGLLHLQLYDEVVAGMDAVGVAVVHLHMELVGQAHLHYPGLYKEKI
jgi:hypothetical protein